MEGKKTKEKKKLSARIIDGVTWLLIFCIIFSFAQAFWTVFLTDFVPRHRTWFWSYESFRKKVQSGLPLQLPQSAENEKYYWSVNRFVHVFGYGVTLSDEDYEEMKAEAIERYRSNFGTSGPTSSKTFYLDTESTDKIWVQEEWLDFHGIEEAEYLLLENESIGDYYILVYNYINNDSDNHLSCILCNDSSQRIIEMDHRNMNALHMPN